MYSCLSTQWCARCLSKTIYCCHCIKVVVLSLLCNLKVRLVIHLYWNPRSQLIYFRRADTHTFITTFLWKSLCEFPLRIEIGWIHGSCVSSIASMPRTCTVLLLNDLEHISSLLFYFNNINKDLWEVIPLLSSLSWNNFFLYRPQYDWLCPTVIGLSKFRPSLRLLCHSDSL